MDIAGWRLVSGVTGNSYTFEPGAVAAALNCDPTKDTTLNTHLTGLEDYSRIYSWNLPLGIDEWPDSGGTAYLYAPDNQLVDTCVYVAPPDDSGNALCS